MYENLILILDATLRVSSPLILAALAGLFSERAGIVNIALEGKMLSAAFAAAATSSVTGSVWLGLLAAIGVAFALSMLHGFASITHRGDQIVSGVAINMLAVGLTVTLGRYWFGLGGQTPALQDEQRFSSITLPGAQAIADVPVIGLLYSELISGHNILVYAALLLVPICWWIVFKTRFGLRLRAAGENPHAVDTAGISVAWIRYRALMVAGILTGLAGAYLSTAHSAGFVPNMSAGKGFIALAALIFGKWKPVPVLFGCLLFGFLDALAIRLQGTELPIIGEIPVQLIEVLPYILTILLLAGFIGRAIGPKSVGIPYSKSR